MQGNNHREASYYDPDSVPVPVPVPESVPVPDFGPVPTPKIYQNQMKVMMTLVEQRKMIKLLTMDLNLLKFDQIGQLRDIIHLQ